MTASRIFTSRVASCTDLFGISFTFYIVFYNKNATDLEDLVRCNLHVAVIVHIANQFDMEMIFVVIILHYHFFVETFVTSIIQTRKINLTTKRDHIFKEDILLWTSFVHLQNGNMPCYYFLVLL